MADDDAPCDNDRFLLVCWDLEDLALYLMDAQGWYQLHEYMERRGTDAWTAFTNLEIVNRRFHTVHELATHCADEGLVLRDEEQAVSY